MSTKNNTEPQTWPEARDFRKSIRWEFSIYVSGIIIVLMLVTGFVITDQYVTRVTDNVVEKLLVQARSYSGPAGKLIIAAESPDALLLSNICKKLSADNPDVYWSGIAGQDDVFLAHTDIKNVISGARMEPMNSVQYGEMLRPGEAFELSGDTLFLLAPIVENNIPVGKLKLAASTRQIVDARNDSVLTVASITVLMMLLGIPLTLIILNRKLRPVAEITDRLKNIDLDHIAIDIPLQKKNEFGYLAATLRVMGARLNQASRERVEKERIARELEIAHEIQAGMLPRGCPVDARAEFAVEYRSALEVGGDYYDFIEIDANRVGFLVADVSGKSLPGMLVMLLTRDIVKRLAAKTSDPAALLCQVNRELLPNIKKGMFVTMFVGVLDKNSGVFTFASAGHNPLIRITTDSSEPELSKTRGFPLGLMPPEQFDRRIEKGAVRLSPGDWLIQFTDGINEARNAENIEYGMDRFLNNLITDRDRTATGLVSDVVARHSEFVGAASQSDDITLLVMKWKGTAVDTGYAETESEVRSDREEITR